MKNIQTQSVPRPLCGARQVADLFGIGYSSVLWIIEQCEIPCYVYQRTVLFDLEGAGKIYHRSRDMTPAERRAAMLARTERAEQSLRDDERSSK